MSASLFRRAAFSAPSTLRTFATTRSNQSVARLTLIGNLADTPELSTTPNGRDIVKYSIAHNIGPRDNRSTSWFRVSSFESEGPRRDYLLSLPKGTTMYVDADVAVINTQDEDGKGRNILRVTQRNFEVVRRPTSERPASESE